MAKRRSRKRGLGGTPSEHLHETINIAADATQVFRGARKSVSDGDCWLALSQIKRGDRLVGKLEAHTEASDTKLDGAWARVSRAEQDSESTHDKFKAKCTPRFLDKD